MEFNLYQLLFPPTRGELETKITDFVKAAGFVSFKPVDTARGKIEILTVETLEGPTCGKVRCWEEINKDWCYRGLLSDLSDDDFRKVREAVSGYAAKVLELCKG